MRHSLAATSTRLALGAVSALAISGIPLVTEAAGAAEVASVTIQATPMQAAYDVDELDETAFTVTVRDQAGAGVAGEQVDYRWVVDPAGEGEDLDTDWAAAPPTGADGRTAVPFVSSPAAYGSPGLPFGTYRLEARHVTGDGAEPTSAQPVSFAAAESEIAFDEDAEARAPLQGSYTVTGRLALAGAGKAALAGRSVTVTEAGAGDVTFAPTADQPAGTTVTGDTATAVTGPDGRFSVTLRDPATDPAPQATVVTAVASALVGTIGRNDVLPTNDAADSEAALTVGFAEEPHVQSIEVDVDALFDGAAAPGRPVDLDISVLGAGGAMLDDVPVTVSVDRGFLSSDAETVADLDLHNAQSQPGDLFGAYEDLGRQVEVSTGDAGDEAGLVAAIGRDAGFDDDGRVTARVTVTAGDVTETREVDFDARHLLNLGAVEVDRVPVSGKPMLGEEVAFHLFARDQFGNLVGDLEATVTDDVAAAEVTTDGDAGATASDWSGSPAAIVATSQSEVVQTVTATLDGVPQTLVGEDRAPVTSTRSATDSARAITWTAEVVKAPMVARLTAAGRGAGDDRLRVSTRPSAAGATVKLFRVADGERMLLRTGRLGGDGSRAFVVRDRNGRAATTYVAQISATATTMPDGTRPRTVR